MRKTLLAIPIASALCHAAPAFAQEAWEYDLTLCSWLEDLSGDVSTVNTLMGVSPRGNNISWVDPIVGLSGKYAINDLWNLFSNVAIGGFGIGVDFESTLLAGVSYTFSDLFSVPFAWHHLSVDYDNDGGVFDITQSGPLIGASFHF